MHSMRKGALGVAASLFTLLLFSSGASAASEACPVLSGNLRVGSRGAEVLRLQQFLVGKGYLASDATTGYFGSLTTRAVQILQEREKIAFSGTPTTTGYGAVGPRTRSAIARCAGGSISATPLAGPTPTTATTTRPTDIPTIPIDIRPPVEVTPVSTANPVWDTMRHPELLSAVYRWRGPEGYLYTTSASQPSAYSGWINEGKAFVVANVKKDGMVPLYRMKSALSYSYTISEQDRASMKRNGAVDDGVVGYLFQSTSNGLVPLHAWYNAQTSQRFLSLYDGLEGAAITAQGHRYEGAIGYVFKSEFPPRIGAYYFGMFSKEAFDGRVRANIQAMYGNGTLPSEFWWSGVRDLFTNNLTSQIRAADTRSESFFAQDWSHLKPAIGWYDQGDPKVIEKHINQATANGISYFNFYWYWDFQKGGEGMNDGLNSFLVARNKEQIDFSVAICEHGWNLTIPASDFQKSADILASKYFTQPNYLKTKDGKLIVQICDPSGIRSTADTNAVRGYSDLDVPALRTFISTLRAAARQYAGRELVLTVRADAALPGVRETNLFDAGTCIAPVLDYVDSAANYPKVVAWHTAQAANWSSFMPCFNERFDERPRVGIMKPSSEIIVQTAPTPATFAAGLRGAKAWMEGRPNDALSHFLTLYAWNEWNEGGILEPNIRDGASLINQIPMVFDVPYISHTCKTSGLCPDAAGRN